MGAVPGFVGTTGGAVGAGFVANGGSVCVTQRTREAIEKVYRQRNPALKIHLAL